MWDWATSHESSQHAGLIGGRRARVLALRGDLDPAAQTVALVIDRVRHTGDPQVLVPTLAAAALIAHLTGEDSNARAFLDEVGDLAGHCWGPTTDICRLLIAQGDVERIQEVVDRAVEGPPRLLNAATTVKGMLAEAGGDDGAAHAFYVDAADAWRAFGNPYELAHSLDGQTRALRRLNRPGEGSAPRDEAKRIFTALGVEWPFGLRTRSNRKW